MINKYNKIPKHRIYTGHISELHHKAKIGIKKSNIIFTHYSWDELKLLKSERQLIQMTGIGKATAKKVFKFFKNKPKDPLSWYYAKGFPKKWKSKKEAEDYMRLSRKQNDLSYWKV